MSFKLSFKDNIMIQMRLHKVSNYVIFFRNYIEYILIHFPPEIYYYF